MSGLRSKYLSSALKQVLVHICPTVFGFRGLFVSLLDAALYVQCMAWAAGTKCTVWCYRLPLLHLLKEFVSFVCRKPVPVTISLC